MPKLSADAASAVAGLCGLAARLRISLRDGVLDCPGVSLPTLCDVEGVRGERAEGNRENPD